MAAFTPTQQQSDYLDAVATGDNVSLVALAGSGKTTSLKQVAFAHPRTAMTYAAFNASTAREAQASFPRNVTCRTLHSFARRAVGGPYQDRIDNSAFVPGWKVAQILDLPARFENGGYKLNNKQLASLIMQAVTRFCHSAAAAPEARFIPKVNGFDGPVGRRALTDLLFPFVVKAWEDQLNPNGNLKFSHDSYLKIWSLTDNPVLPGEKILLDEAQDSNGVTMEIVRKNMLRGAQILPVGDENQQLYEWRGSTDALNAFDVKHRMPLTKSWRFGPDIADEANRILSFLPTDLRVEGNDNMVSRLAYLSEPDAVLCRTNATAIDELMRAQLAGKKAGLVGGTGAVAALARAARDLSEDKPTTHPELIGFNTWDEVKEFATESGEKQLGVLVKLVDQHGAQVLLDAVDAASPEGEAEYLISTGHKAKGREFCRVMVASDFSEPYDPETETWNFGELRLQYVAVTRAMDFLDASALGWLNERFPGQREFVPSAEVPARVVVEREVGQVVCDPEHPDFLVIKDTKYDPDLVSAQQHLPGRKYVVSYLNFGKSNRVLACERVLQVAEKFSLTVSAQARARIAEKS